MIFSLLGSFMKWYRLFMSDSKIGGFDIFML